MRRPKQAEVRLYGESAVRVVLQFATQYDPEPVRNQSDLVLKECAEEVGGPLGRIERYVQTPSGFVRRIPIISAPHQVVPARREVLFQLEIQRAAVFRQH